MNLLLSGEEYKFRMREGAPVDEVSHLYVSEMKLRIEHHIMT